MVHKKEIYHLLIFQNFRRTKGEENYMAHLEHVQKIKPLAKEFVAYGVTAIVRKNSAKKRLQYLLPHRKRVPVLQHILSHEELIHVPVQQQLVQVRNDFIRICNGSLVIHTGHTAVPT